MILVPFPLIHFYCCFGIHSSPRVIDDLRSRNELTRLRGQQPALTRIAAALIKAFP
jgi:hypothetical protein